MLDFSVVSRDKSTSGGTKARAGYFKTAHGSVETPAFMPVGTQGTVKAVNQQFLYEDIKAQIVLSNTYHLYLRPGTEILEKAGGLHKFMNWNKPILTDSGGYQVFSLAGLRKLKPDGVEFSSHLDGSKHFFTPEKIIGIQRSIGSDIIMVLDECTPYPCDYKYAKNSTQLTSDWAILNKEAFEKSNSLYGYEQYAFGIIQGSVYKDLREQSAKDLIKLDFDGYAIGGLAVGEPTDDMYELTDFTTDIMPEDKPRYLMGVGRPENILEAIERGIDMFDCVMPTRNGRNGMLFTSEGIINIKNEKWKTDFSPVDPDGTSFVDKKYSKAYLRHLVINKEMLGAQIASIHNLAFYLNLVKDAREKIQNGTFSAWKEKMVKQLATRL